LLASALLKYANRKKVLVLGLPRGGIPVAFEVARKLRAPLDVFVVRKLGLPIQPELAIGAIASGGVRVLNEGLVRMLNISPQVIDAIASEETKELKRRELLYRGHGRFPEIQGKTVLLIDHGVATGATTHAAVRALKEQRPARLVIEYASKCDPGECRL
jgi:putative phosphoribosyl transferase